MVGLKWFPEKWNKVNINIQLAATILLIFSMGVSLGSRPNFFAEIASMGLKSFTFAAVAILFSVIAVYVLTEKFFPKEEKKDDHSGSC